MSNDARAQELIAQAEKKLKGGVFSFLGSAALRNSEAAELFEKAANLFKVNKNNEKAAKAYARAAECNINGDGGKFEAATNYISAANCLKKSNPLDAVEYLKKAVELFLDEGKFSQAAKQLKDIGEIYESEVNYEEAMKSFENAADYFEGENSPSAANNCLLKVAQYAAQLEDYSKAVAIYEKVAKNSLPNNLLKWGVKDYFLRAGLCHLCADDVVSARRALESYQEMDATFSSQRECQFLQQIVEAVENYDVEAFTQAVVEYDSISKLDQWKTTMLLRIKNALKKGEEESSGLA